MNCWKSHPLRLFRPVRLFNFEENSSLYVYSGLYVYSELQSKQLVVGGNLLNTRIKAELSSHMREDHKNKLHNEVLMRKFHIPLRLFMEKMKVL